MEERWEGYYAIDIVENHMARLQMGLVALGRGARVAWLPEALVPFVTIGITMAATFIGVLFLVIITKLIKLLAVVLGMLLAVVLGMLSYAPDLLPLVALAGALRYACRLLCHTWLRREWCDFVRQLFTAELECPICLEPVPATPWRLSDLPCCRARVCWTCVRRHAESVIDDSRPEMRCPCLPCRQILPDVVVSDAFRRERWQWSSPDILGTRELRKIRTYERWTLTAGLAANSSARMEDVVQCPTEDCNLLWVLPRELRRRKAENEPHGRWNPKAWSLGRHCGLYEAPLAKDGSDLRRLACQRCNGVHCMLCGLRWQAGEGAGHQGKSCVEHAESLPEERRRRRAERSGETAWAGAKPCPGCGARIIRSWGCNHMTCTRCGNEWCWVCMAGWTARHYSCRHQVPINQDQCHIL